MALCRSFGHYESRKYDTGEVVKTYFVERLYRFNGGIKNNWEIVFLRLYSVNLEFFPRRIENQFVITIGLISGRRRRGKFLRNPGHVSRAVHYLVYAQNILLHITHVLWTRLPRGRPRVFFFFFFFGKNRNIFVKCTPLQPTDVFVEVDKSYVRVW